MKSKICIIQATYYPEISKMLFEGATRELIKKGICKENAKFYAPDGALYSKSSRIDSIMEIP